MSKKMHPMAWLAIGCGLLLVLMLIAGVGGCFFVGKKVKDVAEEFEANPAKAAAELMVRVNPELEKVAVDDSAGTMTIRDKNSGEEYTVDFEDLAEGRFEVRDSKGNVTFGTNPDEEGGGITVQTDEGQMRIGGGDAPDDLPGWVPVYPGSETVGTFSTASGDERNGSFQYTTSDDLDAVAAYFKKELERAGLEISETKVNTNGARSTVLQIKSSDGMRSGNVVVGEEDGQTQGMVTYTDKG